MPNITRLAYRWLPPWLARVILFHNVCPACKGTGRASERESWFTGLRLLDRCDACLGSGAYNASLESGGDFSRELSSVRERHAAMNGRK